MDCISVAPLIGSFIAKPYCIGCIFARVGIMTEKAADRYMHSVKNACLCVPTNAQSCNLFHYNVAVTAL